MALLLQDKDVEVVEHAEYPDPMALGAMDQQGMPVQRSLHDVRVRRSRPTEFVQIMPVPPDEVLVSDRATGPSLQDVDFVQHRVHLMLSEVRQMGYDVPDDIADDDEADFTDTDALLEYLLRDRHALECALAPPFPARPISSAVSLRFLFHLISLCLLVLAHRTRLAERTKNALPAASAIP